MPEDGGALGYPDPALGDTRVCIKSENEKNRDVGMSGRPWKKGGRDGVSRKSGWSSG